MSVNETSLNCPNCLLRYDERAHVPKHLPCSHTLCLGCVKDLYKENQKYYPCSKCALTCDWPVNPVRTLNTNNAILRQLEFSRLQHKKNHQSLNQTLPKGPRDGSTVGRVPNQCGQNLSTKDNGYESVDDDDGDANCLNVSLGSPPSTPPPPPPRSFKPTLPPRNSKPGTSSADYSKVHKEKKSHQRKPSGGGVQQAAPTKLSHRSLSVDANRGTQDEYLALKDSYVEFLHPNASSEPPCPKPHVKETLGNYGYLDMNGKSKGPVALGKPEALDEIIASEQRRSLAANQSTPNARKPQPQPQPRMIPLQKSQSLDSGTRHANQTLPTKEPKPKPDYRNTNPAMSKSGPQSCSWNPKAPNKTVDTREPADYQEMRPKLRKSRDPIMCDRHFGDECDRICSTCSKAVCKRCITSSTGKHSEHMILQLDEYLRKLPEIINDHHNQFSNAKTDYLHSQKTARDSYQTWSKQQKEIINERYKYWVDKVQRWKHDAEGEVDAEYVKLEEDIERYDKFAQDQENQFQQCVSVFQDDPLIGSNHLEQLTEINKIKAQMQNLKEKLAHPSFQTMTLTHEDADIELGKFETSGKAETKPELQKQASVESRSVDFAVTNPTARSQESTADTTSTSAPLSPLPCEDLQLMAEVTIGSNENLYQVDVSPFNEVIAVNTKARQVTKYVYHGKQYARKWQKDVKPSDVTFREEDKSSDVRVGQHNIVIRSNGGKTMLFNTDFEKQTTYDGKYGILMATLSNGPIYAAKLIRTGKYRVRMMSMDHQQNIELAHTSGLPKIACYPPRCAVLDVELGDLKLFELESRNLEKTGGHRSREVEPIFCGAVRHLNTAEICDIALSDWRLFALDRQNNVHVYDIQEERIITKWTHKDLGLMGDFVIQKIWCSCVGLLHVLYMDWDSYKLRCYQLKGDVIWRK